jgi:hypothetical protein
VMTAVLSGSLRYSDDHAKRAEHSEDGEPHCDLTSTPPSGWGRR